VKVEKLAKNWQMVQNSQPLSPQALVRVESAPPWAWLRGARQRPGVVGVHGRQWGEQTCDSFRRLAARSLT
jgi:hypothetical protein